MVGVGGALDWDGAIRLHWAHVALVAVIGDVIPGQNTDASARDVVDVTHWCATCSEERTSTRRLYITPSTV